MDDDAFVTPTMREDDAAWLLEWLEEHMDTLSGPERWVLIRLLGSLASSMPNPA